MQGVRAGPGASRLPVCAGTCPRPNGPRRAGRPGRVGSRRAALVLAALLPLGNASGRKRLSLAGAQRPLIGLRPLFYIGSPGQSASSAYLTCTTAAKAEHGYASVLPFDGDFARKKTKAGGLVRKAPNNRSSHNELEKHRRAKLRLYLEQLKQLVPLGPDSTRHTTLSLLRRAKVHIKKLEEQDRRALSIKEQLQREHRFLKRRLEQLSVQSVERVRTDSTGSAISTDDSEQEVDIEGMEFGPGELDSVGGNSDVDDHYSLQSGGCSDGGYGPPCRRPGCPGLS
ncbi:max dimerization protein 4 [Orycteropus afer afer]|uniref:Max dimerization protein 4 n=1 Tax=Orycteropus afer afer TaxID=1230840 RepID=A0AC54ZEM1_ORYAF|nr:max dimerization protein 4 [Orycteropus afer afer]